LSINVLGQISWVTALEQARKALPFLLKPVTLSGAWMQESMNFTAKLCFVTTAGDASANDGSYSCEPAWLW
jgi:hypothetical protein